MDTVLSEMCWSCQCCSSLLDVTLTASPAIDFGVTFQSVRENIGGSDRLLSEFCSGGEPICSFA